MSLAVQYKTTRETEIEMFITPGSWRKYMAHLKGSHGDIKSGCSQREAGLEAHAFIRSVGGMLWGSQAKARLVNPNQKE